MDLGLRGRSFVVGGGARGLGRATADVLVAEGASVLLLGRDADALESACSALGERASWLEADMADPEFPGQLREAAEERFGGSLDGLLLNAGGPPPGDALTLTDEQWRGAYELLLGGPLRLLRELVPLFSDAASVVWIGSSSWRQPIPGLDASNAFRPGIAALVKVLARELAPRVRFVGMAPGRVDTDRVRSLDSSRAERSGDSIEDVRAASEAEIPMGRYGKPEEFGRVAAFLLSPAASYVSGSTVQVDGALITALP
ncbi:MAG: 3-oxoacyl-[acyl-carrier protein] reductase [Thermoleophilaceae bacterium]|jgi:3-oxoacyl-[acyl-carrier protein] reductase|nr:3-oxoacyl-[acyl-carrier protein] reductase [Thermoleophilaceae bacterium]MEA2436816.1 3-oxoacyl-[acyl-carrier protein] reductase [Thermoleophilaceae bacterium]